MFELMSLSLLGFEAFFAAVIWSLSDAPKGQGVQALWLLGLNRA